MGSGMQRATSLFQYVVSSVWGLYVFITRTALAMLQVGVHQRVPVILGSAEDVEECLGPEALGSQIPTDTHEGEGLNSCHLCKF